jgi:putative ABC transport system permease protein
VKYLGLIFKNARRNKRRTALTVLSVAIAVFLFSSLRAVLDAFALAVETGSSTRIVTIRSTSIMFTLQRSQFDTLAGIAGVRDVTYASWFGGIYKDPSNYFAQMAIDAESYLRLYPEIVLTPDERQAFMTDRTGAIVGDGLARRFGFKVGDRIVLGVGIPLYGTQDFTFTIRGIYRAGVEGFDNQSMLFHWKYLDERSVVAAQVGWFVSQIDNPDRAAEVSAAIDQRFANTPYETKTETEKAFNAGFMSMFGNVSLLLGGIITAIVVTTLFVAGNTMAMSVRERTTEVAVMRTLGFPRGAIFFLVAGEAVLMALVGGLIGAGLARLVVSPDNFPALGAMMPAFRVGTRNLVSAIGLGAGIGLVAGALPATLAARLKVVDALRRVA